MIPALPNFLRRTTCWQLNITGTGFLRVIFSLYTYCSLFLLLMLREEVPFTNAYRLEDEPYWNELLTIFNADGIEDPEVIPVDISIDDDGDSVGSNVTD
ncbi:UNVERIFIED_CONTAM: hypothetical protein Sradi_3326100 [Sesamum radiatum]|uniref:Uncharacterized protein n=1 Tax=Sesamum radiatum TaxID=300843 RepID=A0AAW2R2M3_SESRA